MLLDLHRVTRIQHIADRMLDVLLAGLIEDGVAVALVQQGEVAADVAAGREARDARGGARLVPRAGRVSRGGYRPRGSRR